MSCPDATVTRIWIYADVTGMEPGTKVDRFAPGKMGATWESRYDQPQSTYGNHGLSQYVKALDGHHDSAEGTAGRLRNRLREVRSEACTNERSLDIAKRSLGRIESEKQRLEVPTNSILRNTQQVPEMPGFSSHALFPMQASAASDKAYIRKLEAKISATKSSADLQSRCEFYKNKARGLEEEVRAFEARLHASEEVCRHRGEQARHLQRALDLKAKELSVDAGTDVQSRLLCAVAKGEEDCSQLAAQLADSRNTVRRMEEQLRSVDSGGQNKSCRGLSSGTGSGTTVEALEQQLAETIATCRQHERETEEVRSQIRELQRRVERAMLEKSALEERINKERNDKGDVEGRLRDATRLARMDVSMGFPIP
ncbi:unnamed protein product, partial [Ostreobium quekettii]